MQNNRKLFSQLLICSFFKSLTGSIAPAPLPRVTETPCLGLIRDCSSGENTGSFRFTNFDRKISNCQNIIEFWLMNNTNKTMLHVHMEKKITNNARCNIITTVCTGPYTNLYLRLILYILWDTNCYCYRFGIFVFLLCGYRHRDLLLDSVLNRRVGPWGLLFPPFKWRPLKLKLKLMQLRSSSIMILLLHSAISATEKKTTWIGIRS